MAEQSKDQNETAIKTPGSDSADPSRDASDRWPPPPEDVERGRSLYREYRDELRATGQDDSWSKGTNAVGDKPDKSPGDIRDLPPSGKELMEMENTDASPVKRLASKFGREFSDVNDAAKHSAESVQQVLERPPPTGHAETAADSSPEIGPQHAGYGTLDAGSVTELALVLGMIGAKGAKWVGHTIASMRGKADAGH